MPPLKNSIRKSAMNSISVVYRFIDQTIILGSLIISCWFLNLEWTIYHTTAVLALGLFVVFYAEFNSIYSSWRGQSLHVQLRKTLIVLVLSILTLLALSNVTKINVFLNETLLLYWFSILVTLIGLTRIFIRILLTQTRSRGFNIKKAVIVGAGSLGLRLKRSIEGAPWMGIDFVGYYDDFKDKEHVLGTLEALIQDAKAGRFDRIYLTLPMNAEKRMKWLVNELSDSTISVYVVPDIFVFELLHARSENLNGIPTISIYDSPIEGVHAWIKRAEDFVLSSIILLLISPLLLSIAIAVKFTSKGPVLFKQVRYGMGGDKIRVWKFRSMTVTEQGSDVVQATKGDARITPLGAFLRKTSLDELPQFINVLMGDMSIVGPRPHATAHNEYYRKLIDGYMLRHKVKPGITGWAQINGWRGETDTLYKMAKRVKFDLYYIQNWSLSFDLKIIFLTLFKGFVNKNAF
jgi:putative colanic acid biosynthesis UDP-glucose lipid carrier transferase